MRRVDLGPGWMSRLDWKGKVGFVSNIAICFIGVFFLTVGSYATVQSIIDSYAADLVGGVFTCADNGI